MYIINPLTSLFQIRQWVLQFIILVIVLGPFTSKAQLKDSLIFIEDGWIEKMDRYVSSKLSMSNDIETFMVDTETNDVDLYPNTTTIGRVQFNYRILSFSFKFAPDFLPGNGDNEIEGKTSTVGLSGGLNFRHWFHFLSYTRVQGYYLNNTKDYEPTWVNGDPYLQFPELVVKNFEGITGYSFNPKFSVKSLTTQTERQLKNAGSFIPIIGYRYYIVDNRDTDATSTQKSNNFEFILGAGYHYNFIIKENFYFALGVTPGVGYIFTKLTTRFPSDDVVTKSKASVVRWDGRGALGYNGRKFFAGGIMNITSSTFEQEGTAVINSDTRANYQIFIGCRLKAPKKLKENIDKVSNPKKKNQ